MTLRAVLTLVCAAMLPALGCDSLTEPVAITPDDLRPAIVTDLTLRVAEDGTIVLDVEAEDPNGEALVLALTEPPAHGTAVLENNPTTEPAPAPAARVAPAPRPADLDAQDIPEAAPHRRDALDEPGEKPGKVIPKATPRRATPRATPAAKPSKPSALPAASAAKAAGVRASVRLMRGASTPTATAAAVVVGRIRYTPEADFNGADHFAFSVRNTSGFTSEAEVTISIDAEPDPPRVNRALNDTTLVVGQRMTLNLRSRNVFNDPDGDALTFEATSQDATIATAQVTGDVLTVQALNAPTQATRIDLTATDATGLSVTTGFTITVEATDNRPPQVENPISDQALIVGEVFRISLNDVFSDADGDNLMFTASSGNPGVARAEIVPPDSLHVTMLTTGVASITVTASDGIASAQRTFTVFLNPGVNAADDVAETDAGIPVVINVLENDRDSNNGALSIAGFLQFPANGTVEAIDDGQRVRYTPNPAFFGTDTFTYVASNTNGDLDQALVTVTVREVNQPPEIIGLFGTTSGNTGDTFSFSATALDPNEGDVLTFSWDFGDGTPSTVGEALTAVSHVYTAAGTYTLALTVQDDDGALDTAALTVTVTEPSSMLPVARPDLYRLDEGATLAVDAADGVLSNDQDPRGNGLTATLVGNVSHGTLTFQPDGSFTYVHDGTEASTDAFRYRATDGTDNTAEVTVTLAINAVNDPPVAVEDSYSISQDSTLTVSAIDGLLSNDTDVDNSNLVAVLATTVAHGTLTLDSNGSFVYTPNAGFFGLDSFTYRANDGDDDSNEATVSIQVNQAGNTPPVVTMPADQNSVEVQPITPLQIDATDPDTPLLYTTATLPPGLELHINTGLITGTPTLDAAGPTGMMTYAVTIFVTDQRSGQSATTFNWTVTNPNPTVSAIGIQSHDEGETITPIQVQATDDDPALTYDDGGTLPPGLALEANTGLISGTVAADAAGPTGMMTYAVVVTVSDNQGGSDSVAFDWNVTNPDPVVTNPGAQTSTEGHMPTLQIQATDDDTPTFAATNLPTGLVINPGTGEITGTITDDAAGPTGTTTYMVDIEVTDGQTGTTSVQFGWMVTNPAPVVNNPGDQTNSEGDMPGLQILATDDDIVTYAATGLPTGLTIDTNTGEITGTIAMGASSGSPYTVTITVTDAQTATGMVQFTWTVTNPPPVVTNPGDQNSQEGTSPTLQIQATDPDVPLTYAATGLPTGLTIDMNTGEITGTIADDAAGPTGTLAYMVEVTVTDNQSASAAVQFDWTTTNPAPGVTDPGDQASIAGAGVSLQIQATDDDAVTYAATGLPPGLAIDTNTGEITGTIDLDAGSSTPYAVTVTVADNQTGSTDVLFDWSVDHPKPTLTMISPTSGARGATLDVTLTGTNFIDGVSVVDFSGTGITINTTTVNSATEIVVNITIDGAAPLNARDVTVMNPAPGGGTSEVQTFTITL